MYRERERESIRAGNSRRGAKTLKSLVFMKISEMWWDHAFIGRTDERKGERILVGAADNSGRGEKIGGGRWGTVVKI